MNGTMYGMGSLGSGLDDGGAGMNPQTMTKDPKLLTKSTINNDGPPNQHQFQYGGNQLGVQHSASFGPAGGPPGAGGQPLGPGGMDMQQSRIRVVCQPAGKEMWTRLPLIMYWSL